MSTPQVPTSAGQVPAAAHAEEEYHAIKIGKGYVLVNETADKVHLANGIDIGDYNMVKVATVNGTNTITNVKNNKDENFKQVAIRETCVVPSSVAETQSVVQAGGGNLFVKYKCLNDLLNKTSPIDLSKYLITIFGASQKLKILPLVQVGETYIILLYQENHEFMFLTSSDLLSVHDDTMEKIIRNPMSEIHITDITNVENSKQLGIPIMTVRANIQTYGENSSIVIRMYVFPIEANLKDPNAPGSVARTRDAVATAFSGLGNTLKPAGQGVKSAFGTAARATTKGVGAAATAIGKGYSPYFSKVGITYTENEKAALDTARTKFICNLRNLLEPAHKFIQSVLADEQKRAAMFSFITNANLTSLDNLIKTLELDKMSEETKKQLDISKILDDGSVSYHNASLDAYLEYKNKLNTTDFSDLINNNEYKRLSEIIVVFHTLKTNFVKVKANKQYSDHLLGYTILYDKLPKAVGAESAGRAFFSWLAKGTLGVGTALSVPVIGAVKTALWNAPKAALWDAPRAVKRKATLGNAAAMFKPSPEPVDKAANGGGGGSLARAKVRKSRRAK